MKRIKVVRGPTGAMIWAGVIASTVYGFYWVRYQDPCLVLNYQKFETRVDSLGLFVIK